MKLPEFGQKVLISVKDNLQDTGRVTRVKHEGCEPEVLDEVTVRSDSLGGEEVTFRFVPETDSWVRIFQDPLGAPGFMVFSEHEPVYEIIGVED